MKDNDLKNLADAFLNSDFATMLVYLLITCLSIVAVYFHSRIKKSAELREINNNFEVVLSQQRQLTQETGAINELLNRESISYQIRLNAYNEKSIEAINDVYLSMINLRNCAKQLGFNKGPEGQQKIFDSISTFRDTFDSRKIWIPQELSEHIETVAIEIDNRCHSFIHANTRSENLSGLTEERMNKIFDEQEKFYDYINKEINLVFEKLTKRISELVGEHKA